MKVPPPLHEDHLIQTLAHDYRLDVKQLLFLPVGDSAYCYQVQCRDGARYFVKVYDCATQKGRRNVEAMEWWLQLTWKLCHDGLFNRLTYPMENTAGALSTHIDHYAVVLMNFINDQTLAEAYPLSPDVLRRLGASMAEIHRITTTVLPTPERRETFDTAFVDGLRTNLDTLQTIGHTTDLFVVRLKHIIDLHREPIERFLAHLTEYQARTKQAEVDFVLCHGDVWGGNLVDDHGVLYFLDWESAVLAPRERDLFSFVGEPFDHVLPSYCSVLGRTIDLNGDLLTFYAIRQQLQNLAQWVQNVLIENTNAIQTENDLTMITEHCLNRWDAIEHRLIP